MRISYASILFVSEVLCAEFMFLHSYAKRNRFVLRLVPVLGICLIAAALYPGGNLPYPSAFLRSLVNFGRYFGLFSLTVAGQCFLFKEKFGTILSACTAGYAVQHLTQRLSTVLDLFIPFGDGMPGPWGIVIKAIVYFPFPYILCYFAFARRAEKNGYKNEGDKRLNFISIGVVILCMVVTRIPDFGERTTISVLVEGAYSVICCLLVLTLQFSVLRIVKNDKELETTRMLYEKEKTEYKHWKGSIDIINIKCHDLKRRIGRIRQNYSEQSIREIEDSVMIYESAIKTGNDVLDIILFEKNVYCEQHDIQFIYVADGRALFFMEKDDLYSLLCNIIDNAIEGVSELSDVEKRVIHLNVQRVADSLVIRSENYYAGQIKVEDGLPVTNKTDKENHGFGVKSMRMVAEKYGGILLFNTKENVFRLNICIPIPKQ